MGGFSRSLRKTTKPTYIYQCCSKRVLRYFYYRKKKQKFCCKFFLTSPKVHPNTMLEVTKFDEKAQAADFSMSAVYSY